VLESLESMKPAPMIRREDGFIVPCDIQVRQLLLSLPADGKKAFRVFYDDKARALLAASGATGQAGGDPDRRPRRPARRLPALPHLLRRPRAADTLGDAYFERGDFARAARCWRDIIAYCADADISLPRLTVKQGRGPRPRRRLAAVRRPCGAIEGTRRRREVTIGGAR
jgi:hypothetical protein